MTRAERIDLIKQICAKRHISIIEKRKCFHLTGNGVDIVVANLFWVHPKDLEPERFMPDGTW